jgi:Fe-S oxidoreductase
MYQDAKGTRSLDDRAIEVLYQCLECSQCLTWCLPQVDIATMVENERTKLVGEGRYPQGLDKISSAIRTNHNPFAEPHGKRNKWFVPTKNQGQKITYFAGCTAAYHENGIALSTVSILSNLGYKVSMAPDEWCCGSPLFRTGFRDLGIEQARHNAAALNKSEGNQIVVTCPGCFRALTKDYPQVRAELKKPVLHISQLLEKHLDNLKPAEFGGPITYHDPCHLGRHSGIYDPPRRVIERVSGKKVVEMARSRENAMCCGNGAGMRTLFTDQAHIIGDARLSQAREVGAKLLVTSCPFCKNMLASRASEGLTVLDLPEIVMAAWDSASKVKM